MATWIITIALPPTPRSVRGNTSTGGSRPGHGEGIVVAMAVVERLMARVPPRDLLLPGVLGMVALAGTHYAGLGQLPRPRPIDLPGYLLMGSTVVPLLVRRAWPLQVLAITTGAVVVYLALGYPYGPVVFLPCLAIYSVAVGLPSRRSAIASGLALLAILGVTFVRQLLSGPLGITGAGVVAALVHLGYWLSWTPLPWVVGVIVRLHREGLRRDREQAGRSRAYEERLGVAREVHDIVGHGLAVINMQAGIALHVLEKRPEQARVALEAIRETSKAALQDVRGTLAVFREQGAANGSRRPAPSLAELDTVVTAMEGSGLPVRLSVTGKASLPTAVDLAAYRIVQESLTNVLRHAGPATATVHIDYRSHELVVEVTDDGPSTAAVAGRSGGHGIAGMRERASAVGGTLEAGPRPEGGFRVVARLPSGGARQ
jgi:signal transduction histidine kinase